MSNAFSLSFFLELFPVVLPTLSMTLKVSLVTFVLTFILSVGIAVIRYFKIPVVTQILAFCITFFRAVPLVALLYLAYYGLCTAFPALRGMSPYRATVFVLTINTAAFMSETFRGALEAIEPGQLEACYSMGMTRLQAIWRAALPQAMIAALPAVGNHFIGIIKGSALGFTVGLMDIMAVAKIEANHAFRYFESYLCVAVIYFVIVVILEQIQKRIEYRLTASIAR